MRVHLALRPVRCPRLPRPDPSRHPQTMVVPAVLGDDGTLLKMMTEHVDGLVVAAFGVGHVPASWVPILADTCQRIPVILASRTGSGSVLASTYGFPGSESDLLARGSFTGSLAVRPTRCSRWLSAIDTARTNTSGLRATTAPTPKRLWGTACPAFRRAGPRGLA
jgi:L-asparaginase